MSQDCNIGNEKCLHNKQTLPHLTLSSRRAINYQLNLQRWHRHTPNPLVVVFGSIDKLHLNICIGVWLHTTNPPTDHVDIGLTIPVVLSSWRDRPPIGRRGHIRNTFSLVDDNFVVVLPGGCILHLYHGVTWQHARSTELLEINIITSDFIILIAHLGLPNWAYSFGGVFSFSCVVGNYCCVATVSAQCGPQTRAEPTLADCTNGDVCGQ